jgi:hypothetical protein
MHTKIHSSKSFVKRCRWLVALASGLLIGHSALAAVTFTITPSAVSNTYSGLITLSIGGLTNTETVVVQKFLDLNTNGIIDGSDMLVQQFNLTDGTNFVIGGVTNFNVPGDLNATPGAITATLNFQNGDFVQNIIGKYLYKLSSPAGHFPPLTNNFSVTNFPFAQKFTGLVVSNSTSTTVSNAIVLLFPPPRPGHNGPSTPQAGTVANNAGSYTIQAPPGTYVPMAFRSNYVANYTASPVLTLGSGATITTNLTSTNATASISGKVVDANNASIGLPGVMVTAMSANGLLAISFTDTNGNFNVRVTAGQWGIQADDTTLFAHGYLGLQNGTIVTAGATGVTLTVPKATALIYGSVKDNLGNPLPGIDVYAYDNNNLYQTDGYTDASGNYVAGVLGGLGSNDPWQVEVGNSSSFPNYIFSQSPLSQNGGTNMTVGKVVLQNFTAILATNHITGHVQYNGNPVSGVQVYAYANINGVDYQSWMDTDTSGNYSLNVGNGNWNVNVYDCGCSDNDSLNNIIGGGNYQDPSSQNVNINNNNGMANFTASPNSVSIQIFGSVTLIDGTPIVGVTVHANDGVGDNYSTSTDGTGYYSFDVGSGNWDVSVDCGSLNSLGYQCVCDQNVNVSSSSVEQDFDTQFEVAGSLQITMTSLLDGIVGGTYSQRLYASGGQPCYRWSLTPGSLPLPGGLNLSNGGIISGTPTNNAPFGGTNYYFSVRVTDNVANTVDLLLSLTIYPPLTIATNALPNGTVGTAYSTQMLVSGGDPFNSGGSPSGYVLPGLMSGSLPPGLNFSYGATTSSNQFFVISGTPTNSGTFSFAISPYDADDNHVEQGFLITILSSTLQITTASLSNATVGMAYAYQLQVSGGTTPYTWTIANGSQPLPSALALSTDGLISGVPATSGTNSFIVRLTDHNSLTVTRTLTLIVNSKPVPVLGLPMWLTNRFQMRIMGASNQNYMVQMSTNLSSTNWISLFITNNTTTNSFLLTDPNATNQQRFYRILIGQ